MNGRILINGETYKEGKITDQQSGNGVMPLHWKQESTGPGR
ncbi:MAG: hypothetical protein ACLT4D_07880 [Blautia faecis]